MCNPICACVCWRVCRYPGQFHAELRVSIANEPDVSRVDAYYYGGFRAFKGDTADRLKPIHAAVSFTGTLNVYGLTAGNSGL